MISTVSSDSSHHFGVRESLDSSNRDRRQVRSEKWEFLLSETQVNITISVDQLFLFSWKDSYAASQDFFPNSSFGSSSNSQNAESWKK